MDEHTWEQSKENAAPIATGRSVSTLAPRAFGTSSHENEIKTKKYEKLIRRSEKASEWLCQNANRIEGELTDEQIDELKQRLSRELGYNPNSDDADNIDRDPLKYWILYIKHIRTSYPSDTQRQFLLMERCARTFLATPFLHPDYVNDPRLIRTCILYADKTSVPNEVFKRMNSLKVGNKVALFWVAWAWLAEKRGDYSFCEKIFQKALRVGAEPKKFLMEREKQFLRRMSRHWLNTTKNDESLDEEDGVGETTRGALSSLEARGGRVAVDRVVTENGPSGFPSRSQRDSDKNNAISLNSTAGFAIFQDENSVDHHGLDDEKNRDGGFQLTKECDRTKENNMKAEQWNERGYGLFPSAVNDDGAAVDSIVSTRGVGSVSYGAAVAPTPAFDVFVDEECVDEQQKTDNSKLDDRSLRQRLDGGTADRIRRDPLRYMKHPGKVTSDQEKYDSLVSVDVPGDGPIESTVKQDVKVVANPRRGGYDKELLRDASGRECCFEERRVMAKYYRMSSSDSDFNLLKQQEPEDMNTSLMDVEESIDEVNMEEIPAKNTTQRLKSALKPPSKSDAVNTSVVTRRVLFGASTLCVQNDESLNTSTASSQPNGSFVRDREETINTKFANAEISMMFCSPNNNESMTDQHGRSFLTSTSKKPLFSTSRKNSAANQSIHKTTEESYAIFQDEATDLPIYNENPSRQTNIGTFSIFQEGTDENDDKSILVSEKNCPTNSNGDETATMSALNEVLSGGGGLGFEVRSDSPSKAGQSGAGSKSIIDKSGKTFDATASLSDIGALMGDIRDCSIKATSTTKQASAGAFSIFSDEEKNIAAPRKVGFAIHDENASTSPDKVSNNLGFDIFADENAVSCQKKRKIDEPSSGDISQIENDEKTSDFHVHGENVAFPSNPIAIDYLTKHKSDMESAMRQCMKIASKSSCDLRIFDYRNKPIPRELLRKSFSKGFAIDLFGGKSFEISHELGRGVHGVVLLCTGASKSTEECQNDALKIQAPIGSLAHEYSILLRLEERIDLDSSGFYPFPQPQALYAFTEGGLFLMTAGSYSGMTLLDVVNTYKQSIGSVPEMVAIYYTARMLRHLKCLHHNGKVLHCDVKPDNWVLTRSREAGLGAVSGADLMLVDFGRAVDLESVSSNGSNILFSGSAAAEDMECRSMRQGLPWGADLDYFGLCASSCILLFGDHMEVVQDKTTGRLKLKKLLRRYWQRDLWSNFFDVLLNNDVSSDSNCLQDLLLKFEEHLEDDCRKRDIDSRISTLYTHLPKKR